MNWSEIIGQEKIKQTLIESVENNRVSHAQLFVGEDGYGGLPLVLAYVTEILKRENQKSVEKINHLNHIDVHFSFPFAIGDKNRTKSQDFFDNWREMIIENPYSQYQDWVSQLDAEKKQLIISVEEIKAINEKFSLKSFEGGTKILIMWHADKMREDAANKFLKFLEEPPEKTIIILTATSTDTMLQTILSRCQITQIHRIEDEPLKSAISQKIESTDAIETILHQAQGNYNTALKLINADDADAVFEDYFIQWVRLAFMAKKKPEMLKDLLHWAKTIAEWSRERQKSFLGYALEMFRLALMQSYNLENLVYKKLIKDNFKWEVFSSFIHGANIEYILNEISEADYHLSRNANAKILWTDMGIKLTRYLHRTY